MPRLSLAVAVRGKCDARAFWNAIAAWQGTEAYLAYDDPSVLEGMPDWVQPILCPALSVFEMWGNAIARGDSDYVAVLSPFLVPSREWLAAMSSAIAEGGRAYVGPVEEAYGSEDQAIIGYVVEYGHFHRPLLTSHGEVPGTNIIIRRDQLAESEDLTKKGFSKTSLLQQWASQGYRPPIVESAAVIHRRPYDASAYRARRYQHGRSYAASQREKLSSVAIVANMAKALLLPIVRVWRIRTRTRHIPKLRRVFRRHFLAILEAESAWSAGEFAGYALGNEEGTGLLD